ncbi:MAG: hypothetical protein D6682_06390 [Zetaproteobacteria bacterium]|nr:MAG: hypothetical protein D6682_06390 [Zetaproteobacteria bacterium]
MELFRISGIYGPGRNLIERLRRGGYVAVAWDPPRYANRIHVDDLVEGVVAAIARPRPGRVVNLTDDLPSPHADYVRALARAAGAPDPLVLAPEEARRRLSPDYLAFFRANRRVSNRLLHRELLPRLRYPSFRAALPSLLAGGA